MIISIVLVVVVAVVGYMVVGNNKSSSSTTATSNKPTLSSLSTRADNQDTSIGNINTLITGTGGLNEQIAKVQQDITTANENYTDLSGNIDTILQAVGNLSAWQTAHSATPTPTPTPTVNTTPTPTPTVNATPTPTVAPTPTPTAIPNRAPVIDTFVVDPPVLEASDGYAVATCTAHDPDGGALTYTWAGSNGTISGVGPSVFWVKVAGGVNGSVGVIVSDGTLSASYTATIVCK